MKAREIPKLYQSASQGNDHALAALHVVAQRHDRLDGLDHGRSVILLFRLGEFTVWNETGMCLLGVVPLRTIAPTFVQAFPRPVVVIVLRQALNQFPEIGCQLNA